MITLIGASKQASKPFAKQWYLMFLPAAALIILVFTNDLHQTVFSFPKGLFYANKIYEWGPGFYIILAWIVGMYIADGILLYIKCRISYCRRKAWIPFVLFIGCFFVCIIREIFNPLFLNMPETVTFSVVVMCESLIRVGFIPSNTEHAKFFDMANISACIANNDLSTVLRSKNAPELTYEQAQSAASSGKKYYYDCAYCNQIGTTTWDSTTYGEHNYAATWSSDADGHWHECSLCHDKKDKAAHTPGAAATETTPQKCTECDYIITPALGHTHSLTKVEAKAPTCTEDGNKAYYVCSGCSKWFEDAAGNVEITDHSSVVIGHLGHDWKDATCTAPKTCKRCGATEGDPLGHTFGSWSVTKAATETEKGEMRRICSVCGYLQTMEILPTGHTHSYGAEWKSDSNTHWHECDCGGKTDVGTHQSEIINKKPATETENGYTGDTVCKVCGYQIAEGTVIPKTGTTHSHAYGDWKSDSANHWKECECGDKSQNSAHSFVWVVDKQATDTAVGSKHEECSVCGYARAAVEIPATGASTTTTPPDTEPTPVTTTTPPESQTQPLPKPQPGDDEEKGSGAVWIAIGIIAGLGVAGGAGAVVYVKKKKEHAE